MTSANAKAELYALFGDVLPIEKKGYKADVPAVKKEQEVKKPVLFSVPKVEELNGVQAANRAVANCGEDGTLIFLTRSEYQDLVNRSNVPDLKTYKKKTICIVSDPITDEEFN